MAFPPRPTYPDAIDTDYTLFLVYNTAEARTCADSSPWAEEIDIVPVAADQDDVWADNGFANIDGELFYYDAVTRNDAGKVTRLRKCARGLQGTSHFVPRGSWVRGFVIAEHHNQLVDVVLRMQNFIGRNFDERHETLDWRIRNLRDLKTIGDDFSCPDVTFVFNILQEDNETGILASYAVDVEPPTAITSFRIDFGDGEFTTTQLSGTHLYALNARIDPVVTVSNSRCEIVQTPNERTNPSEPRSQPVLEFDFPIPQFPDFPDFNVVTPEFPEIEILSPPLVLPCPNLTSDFPSVVIGPDGFPSHVVISGPDFPVQLPHSVIQVVGGFSLPSLIVIDTPPTITIDPPVPPTIIVDFPSSLAFDFGDVPTLQMDWGTPPPVNINMVMMRAVNKSAKPNEFGDEFSDIFQAESLDVAYEPLDIPREIKLVVPENYRDEIRLDCSTLPDAIQVDASQLPSTIKVDSNIPARIVLEGPDTPLPSEIRLVQQHPLPEKIMVEGLTLPERIVVELRDTIPERIIVEQLQPLPDVIRIDASDMPRKVQIEGMPSSVQVTGFPAGIPVIFPEQMPAIPLVYNGPAIEMKLTMEPLPGADAEGKYPCVMLTPCNR